MDLENVPEVVQRRMLKGTVIGGLAGIVGGIIVGESLNDYVEFLRQAPATVHYAVDVAAAYTAMMMGVKTGNLVATTKTMYDMSRRE